MEKRSARYEPARLGASRRTDNAAPPAMKIRAESVPSIVGPFVAARQSPRSPFIRRLQRPVRMKIVEAPQQPDFRAMAGHARKARRPSGRPSWKVFANLHLRAGPSRRRASPGDAERFRNHGSQYD